MHGGRRRSGEPSPYDGDIRMDASPGAPRIIVIKGLNED
jgi:hypothetical protein